MLDTFEKQVIEFATRNLIYYFLGKENRPSINENYPF